MAFLIRITKRKSDTVEMRVKANGAMVFFMILKLKSFDQKRCIQCLEMELAIHIGNRNSRST